MHMLNKKLLSIILIVLFVFDFAFAKKKKNLFDDSDMVFDAEAEWQILEWGEDEPDYVSFYEIVIQQYIKKTDEFVDLRTIRTSDNSTQLKLDPLLEVGSYRYKIITYDLLELPQVESDWYSVDIRKAYEPEISDISSQLTHSSVINLEEINDGIFNIKGTNLFELPKENADKFDLSTTYELKMIGLPFVTIVPDILEYDKNNRGIKIKLNMEQLDIGRYRLIATDSSGLESKRNPESVITVRFKKPVDFNVSGGYAVPVVLWDYYWDEYDSVYKGTFTDILNQRVFFLPNISFYGKAEFMFYKRKYGYIGIGANLSYTRIYKNVKSNNYKISGDMISANGLFVFQVPINIRVDDRKSDLYKTKHLLTLELHAGPGSTVFNNFVFDFYDNNNVTTVKSPAFGGGALDFVGGGAVQLYLLNRLFVEVNVDFIYSLQDGMNAAGFGILVPSINAGWQF